MKNITMAALAALSVTGCTAMNDSRMDTDNSTTMPEAAMPYLQMAAASDMYEKESSNLALARSQDSNVRDFAQMMITDHTKTTQTLMSAARSAGLTPPAPQMNPMQQRMVAELRNLNGAAFDRVYLDQQTKAHEMAVTLHRNYAMDGDNPSLRSAASAAVPIVTGHLERVRRMNDMM